MVAIDTGYESLVSIDVSFRILQGTAVHREVSPDIMQSLLKPKAATEGRTARGFA